MEGERGVGRTEKKERKHQKKKLVVTGPRRGSNEAIGPVLESGWLLYKALSSSSRYGTMLMKARQQQEAASAGAWMWRSFSGGNCTSLHRGPRAALFFFFFFGGSVSGEKITATCSGGCSRVPLTAAPRAKIGSSIKRRRERGGERGLGTAGDVGALLFLPRSSSKAHQKERKKEKSKKKKRTYAAIVVAAWWNRPPHGRLLWWWSKPTGGFKIYIY